MNEKESTGGEADIETDWHSRNEAASDTSAPYPHEQLHNVVVPAICCNVQCWRKRECAKAAVEITEEGVRSGA